MNDEARMQLVEDMAGGFIALAEEMLLAQQQLQKRVDEGYIEGNFKDDLRSSVILGLALKAWHSFERLIVDVRAGRAESAHHLKTMVESHIYICWVSADRSEDRASRLYAEGFRSRAVYHEMCSTSAGDADAKSAQEWREFEHKQKEGKNWKRFPHITDIASEGESSDLYIHIYKAACEAAHMGDLLIYMPPRPTQRGSNVGDMGLQQSCLCMKLGNFVAYELLRNYMEVLGMDSTGDEYLRRNREIESTGASRMASLRQSNH